MSGYARSIQFLASSFTPVLLVAQLSGLVLIVFDDCQSTQLRQTVNGARQAINPAAQPSCAQQ